MKGFHLTLDVNINKKYKLDDFSFIYNLLNDIVRLIEMTPISPPIIVKYDGKGKKEEWGLSGFILIAESHISIHTYPEKDYFSMDVYSCKLFDKEAIISFISNIFESCIINTNFIKRGLDL